MKKSYLLRLLTLIIYFLPFSFFYSGCEGDAYNKADAARLEKQDSIKKSQKLVDSSMVNSGLSMADTNKSLNTVSIEAENKTSFKYKFNKITNAIGEQALMPTKDSISAFGVTIVFVNMFGRICIMLSIAIALLSLTAERFFREKDSLIKNLLLFNLLCVVAFIIDGYIYHVELKFGVFLLLAIVLLQLILEYRRNTAKPHLNESKPSS